MSTKLVAGTATSGAVLSSDTSSILELQTGSTPTTAITVDASQNVSFSKTFPNIGITNGSVASAGYVGEYTDVSTTFISVSTGTNLTSLTLTAGEWDITGTVQLYGSSGSNAVYGAINTTSGSVTGVYGQNYVLAAAYNAGGTGVANISRYRVNITSTTTYYLNASLAGSSNNCLGFMSARRMR